MRLTDSQFELLLTASIREDRIVMLPPHLRSRATRNSINDLLNKGLLTEIKAGKSRPIGRSDGSGRSLALCITREGQAAIVFAQELNSTVLGLLRRTDDDKASVFPAAPRQSKQALVLGLLQKGTTLSALAQATRWKPHTLRAFFTAVVRKKLRLPLNSHLQGDQRIYRIEQPKASKGLAHE